MEDASADVTSELLDALLSGTNSKRLEELASTWRHAQTPKLLAAVCGLRFPPFPKEDELLRGAASTVLALQVALAKLLDSAVKPGAQGPAPLLGTLQTLPPQGARQVMTRISKLYSLVVGMLVSAESKCLGDPLLELLAQLQLISGTPLRSLRQAASAAALGALQALLAERHVARGALAELETQKRALMDAAGDAAAAARLARLCRGTAQLETLTQQMDVEVGKLQERVLLPRLQDTAAILRRFTLNALGRYMQLKFLWTPERILQGFFDPAPEVRLQAIEIAGAWFEGDLDDPALVREAASHLAERSRDSEPRVSAAALRHLRHPVLVSQLSDDDFARVANLALTAPDSHGLLRVEAALFVEQHLLPEPGLGIAAKKQPGEEGDDLERHFITEHGLMAVADFLTSYLPENDQLHLSRRFVEALWLRTDAFRRWSALADLCLLGEGQGAARGVPCLPNRQRLALLVVLDAALKCAEVPGDATEALLPRLPRLFELFTAEGLCFLDVLASISRRLICAACQKDEALPRTLLVGLLSALRTRRSGVHAMLQLAEALVAWAERSSEVQTATRQLVLDLYSSLSLQLSSPTSELSQVLGPLLALGHRGVDLWTCDKIGLGNKIFGSALSILEASDGQQPEGEAVPPVSPRVAAELLQLLTLLSCWRARCLLGEASKENSGFLMWCHLIRASCSKVMAGEANDLLLRLEAFSCYLLLLHLEFLGHKDTQGLPKVPEQHLTSIDLALRDFYAGHTTSSSSWRQSAAQLGGRDVTICRWLIDRYLREADEADGDATTPERWEEVRSMVASCASRMLAECQHEAIYTSSAAERLLQQLGHVASVDPGKSGSDTQVAALQLLSRLRRYGNRSAHEAAQGYQMQFRAAARHAKENGLESGLQLAKTLIHWSAPPIIAGRRAATQLGRGMTVALKACSSKGETEKMGLDLEVLVPWLRDAGCPLPGPAAQKLATQLAEDFGLLGQSITAHPQKRPRPWRLTAPAGVWPLVTALQAIGSRIPRSNSWQAKLQETAKRRLAKRRPAQQPVPPVPPAATVTWLAPLEKKSPEATVKRKRDEKPRSTAPRVQVPQAPQAAPAKRKWQLKDE